MTYPTQPPAPAPMHPAGPAAGPRPSRAVRWAVGGATAAVLLLVAVVAVALAIGRSVAGAGGTDCVFPPGAPGMFCQDDSLTEEAMATVVRVDDLAGADPDLPDGESPPPLPFDLPLVSVDLTYTTVSGEQVRARDIAWPTNAEELVEGATVRIAYDPADPEYSVTSASALAAARAEASGADGDRQGPSVAGPLWTAGGAATAAVVVLVLTVVWVRRAPRPVRPAYGTAPYPAWGYPPQYPAQYPPPYAPQQYPPQAYPSPQQYPPQQYPQAYPTQPSAGGPAGQPPGQPPAQPPGSWTSPG